MTEARAGVLETRAIRVEREGAVARLVLNRQPLNDELLPTENAEEGLHAFLAKRLPKWEGR